MGMIANYQAITKEQLEELRAFDLTDDDVVEDMVDAIEDWQDDIDILLDIDKMWDGLHFLFTGHSSDEAPGTVLSQAVLGETAFDTYDYIATTSPDVVKSIVTALRDFDVETALDNLSREACQQAELYPDIWNDDEEWEEILEELRAYFHHMLAFYERAASTGEHVLVSIY